MNTDEHRSSEARLSALSERIIGCAFRVSNSLGCGFLEKVYQRAMVVELRLRNLTVDVEPYGEVFFKNVQVGHYVADLLVEDKVLVELKVASELNNADLAQLINELHVLRREVGLLINFGRKGVQFKRAVHSLFSSPPSDSSE